MPSIQLPKMTQSQRDRLAFVELRLRFIGEIRRQDLVVRFGIQAAAATRDLGQYKELGPRNLEYDTKGRRAADARPCSNGRLSDASLECGLHRGSQPQGG